MKDIEELRKTASEVKKNLASLPRELAQTQKGLQDQIAAKGQEALKASKTISQKDGLIEEKDKQIATVKTELAAAQKALHLKEEAHKKERADFQTAHKEMEARLKEAQEALYLKEEAHKKEREGFREKAQTAHKKMEAGLKEAHKEIQDLIGLLPLSCENGHTSYKEPSINNWDSAIRLLELISCSANKAESLLKGLSDTEAELLGEPLPQGSCEVS